MSEKIEQILRPRELMTLEYLASGSSLKEITARLSVSRWTTYRIVDRLCHKLEVESSAAAVGRGVALGIVTMRVVEYER